MNSRFTLVDRDGLPMTEIRGFESQMAQSLAHRWGLAIRLDVSTAPYLVERIQWGDTERRLWEAREGSRSGLTWVEEDGEDTLIGEAGLVRIKSGRPCARVALRPGPASRGEIEELFGAAITHALAQRGEVPLHAMAAVLGGFGVLVAGGSMAGKSTLSLAFLRAGGRIVSDDFVLCGLGEKGLIVRALRDDLVIRSGSLELVPYGIRHLLRSSAMDPARVVLRRTQAPAAFVESMRPDAVWFLERDAGFRGVGVEALALSDFLALLLAEISPLFASHQYETERIRVLPILERIVETVPGARVRIGPCLLEDPCTVVGELLKESAGIAVLPTKEAASRGSSAPKYREED